MNDKEKNLILAMAGYMGIPVRINCQSGEFFKPETGKRYNPLTNGTQLNEFIEKAKLDILFDQTYDYWETSNEVIADPIMYTETHKDRTESIKLCAAKFLGVDYE